MMPVALIEIKKIKMTAIKSCCANVSTENASGQSPNQKRKIVTLEKVIEVGTLIEVRASYGSSTVCEFIIGLDSICGLFMRVDKKHGRIRKTAAHG